MIEPLTIPTLKVMEPLPYTHLEGDGASGLPTLKVMEPLAYTHI